MKDRQVEHPPTPEPPHVHTDMSEKSAIRNHDPADPSRDAPKLQPASAVDGIQTAMARDDYKAQLRLLQVVEVKLQRHFIACGDRILVILESTDAAGKDGSIKRIVEHLSPRETRVVALGKPSDRDRSGCYFQRLVPHLPVAQKLVLSNRSWYNRADVEQIMGFCTQAEHEEFKVCVPQFEGLLVHLGNKLL